MLSTALHYFVNRLYALYVCNNHCNEDDVYWHKLNPKSLILKMLGIPISKSTQIWISHGRPKMSKPVFLLWNSAILNMGTVKFSIRRNDSVETWHEKLVGWSLKKNISVVAIPQFCQGLKYFMQAHTVITAHFLMLLILRCLYLLSLLLECSIIYSFSRGPTLLKSEKVSDSNATSNFLFDFWILI